jgi:hypothetical protein
VVILLLPGGSGGAHRAARLARAPATTLAAPPATTAAVEPSTTAAVPPSTTTTTTIPQPVAAPFSSSETSAAVVAENSVPGTRDWMITKLADHHQIEGYAGAVSIEKSSSVQLFVSTNSPTWQVQAFRMGWYAGMLGRLVWSQADIPGAVQPACPLQPGLNMVSCNWSNPLTVGTIGWPPGTYLLKLQSAAGWQSYVPLTIRDDLSPSAYLVNDSVTTWEAYNQYGGYDLYEGPTGSLATRSRAVSFDRPYAVSTGGGDGSADFLGLELPMISMMESHGLDVSYTTDVDVSTNPSLLADHSAFISLGHDEYYSLSMYQGLLTARNKGVNLVFLGANAVYRHIRLQPSALGPSRVEVDYKDAAADPLLGKDNADVTAWSWRAPPTNKPESALIGEMWECNPVSADMVITDPGAWVFDGTGLVHGSRIPGIVGPEYDHYTPSQPNPGDVTVLAGSPVDCNGRHSTADMTYYSNPTSNAGVWATGTIDWVGKVAGSCQICAAPNAVTRVTQNVLSAFGTGPAGLVHPSVANTVS